MSHALRLESETYTHVTPATTAYTQVLEPWESANNGEVRKRFAQLIKTATDEITGRFPDYFSQFSVEVQSIEAVAREAQSLPAFEGFSTAELELAILRGLRVLGGLGVPFTLDSESSDDISMMMLQSILDAYAAVHGSIGLSPGAGGVSSKRTARGRYALGESRSGVPFAFRKGEGRPLLIISNTGAPLSLWSTLINDGDFRRPWIAVPSRAGSLLEGGTPNSSSLLQDVKDIMEVLGTGDLDQVDVVAWGNGGRTAIALARELPQQVRSLLLVSPSFYGSRAADKYPSPFEDFLAEAYEIARHDRVRAWSLIEGLPQLGMWNARNGSLPSAPRRRVESVLRLPPQGCLKALFAPFADVESFRNYVQRLLEDGLYDVGAAVWEIRCPIVLVTGTNDAAVNTQLPRDMLETYGSDVLHATLSGAGHHIPVLQYEYLRYLLDTLADRTVPVGTARMRIDRLA